VVGDNTNHRETEIRSKYQEPRVKTVTGKLKLRTRSQEPGVKTDYGEFSSGRCCHRTTIVVKSRGW
jgi:hypothetical protein